MLWLWITLGALCAGVLSVWLAAALAWGLMARFNRDMLSFAAGTLLATAFLNLLPEAFEMQPQVEHLMGWLLGGLVVFFLLDKVELYHHGHEHGHEADTDQAHRPHGHVHTHDHSGKGSWTVLFGDGLHAFGDGALIASAFVADFTLGWLTTLAVLVHEVPHHMGDLAVVRQASRSLRSAVLKVSLAGGATVLGAWLAYGLLLRFEPVLPYLLVLAASSFIYVALADLIPQLQQRLTLMQTAQQVAWLGFGVALIAGAAGVMGHGH